MSQNERGIEQAIEQVIEYQKTLPTSLQSTIKLVPYGQAPDDFQSSIAEANKLLQRINQVN